MATRAELISRITAPGQPYELVETLIDGRVIRTFRHAPESLRALYSEARSEREFLVYQQERLSFEAVWRRACAVAMALVEDYGIRPGSRVAIALRNYPEWMIAFMAVTSVGAVAVGLNAFWQGGEMAAALEDADAEVVFVDQERLDRLKRATAGAPRQRLIGVRLGGDSAADAEPFSSMVARYDQMDMPGEAPAPDQDAIMLFTSGSGGAPKGVLSTHRAVISALLSWEVDAAVTLQAGDRPSTVAPSGAAVLLGIPLFHVTGLHSVFLSSFRQQRRLVSMFKWNAKLAAALIEAERITIFTAPAAMTGDLLQTAAHGGFDLTSLRTVGGGGAARAPDQVRALARTFPGAQPSTGWGMTETNAIGLRNAGQAYLDHPESAGRASAVLDLRVVDEAGQPLPLGASGELQVKGASLMRSYWNRPDEMKAAFDGEWFRTGDVARFDEDGFVYIVDRLKDIVIRGGENISTARVEAVLLEHPSVVEACVFGVPSDRLGEEVEATIFGHPSLSQGDLRYFLMERLAAFEVPRIVHFAVKPLPRLASGKIAKREVRTAALKPLEKI